MLSLSLYVLISAVLSNAPRWPDLSTPPRTQGGGSKDAALIIGIEDYAQVEDIAGASQNAEEWFRYLVKTRNVPLSSVVLLKDGDAVDHKIREEARRVAGMVQEGGTLWFVFIGHGAPSIDGRDGLLIGADAQRSAEGIYRRSVTRNELLLALTDGEAHQTVLVLDACFSGQGPTGEPLVEGLQPMIPLALPPAEVTILSATQSGQFAGPLQGEKRPAFSYLVLGALRGWGDANGDEQVTAVEAVEYARGALSATVRDRQQRPELQGPDLILARGREDGPDLVELALTAPAGHAPTDVEIELGADADFSALAEQARSAEAAAQEAQRQAAEARAALEKEQSRLLNDARNQLLEQAREDWRKIEGVAGSPQGRRALEAYIRKYGEASVRIDDQRIAVTVPEVQQAQKALERLLKPGSKKRGRQAERKQLSAEEERELARQKRHENIEFLKEILANRAPVGDQKAELMLRLADLYFEESRDIYLTEMEAFEKAYDACLSTPGCNAENMKAGNVESRKWQERSIKLYQQILQNHPQYPRADEATFYLASALQDIGERDAAAAHFTNLVRAYPDSKYVPDSFVQIGEYYFDNNNTYKALLAYERATRYRDTDKYAFAMYKLAWCYYNVGEYRKGIDTMKAVVAFSMTTEQAGDGNWLQLQQEAFNDLIRFFIDAGVVEEAQSYFTEIGRKELFPLLLKRMAEEYERRGYPELSVQTYRRLLTLFPQDPQAPSHQYAIASVYQRSGQIDLAQAEVNLLLSGYGPGSDWSKANANDSEALRLASDYRQRASAPPGEWITPGYLEKSIIDAVVKDHMNHIRYCYQRELTNNPNLGGKIVVKFVIANDGTVSEAELKSSTMGSASVENCIVRRFLEFQFPAPAGGGRVIVTYPFIFSPG